MCCPFQAGLRSIWDKYFADAHALVFVVDSSDGERLEEAQRCLASCLASRDLAGCPLLVLANKSDIAGREGLAAVGAVFGSGGEGPGFGRGGGGGGSGGGGGPASPTSPRVLPTRLAAVLPCCALTGEGLGVALAWAVGAAKAAARADRAPPASHASPLDRRDGRSRTTSSMA